MNMRNAFMTLLACLWCLTASPQNTFNTKTEIVRSLTNFFGVLSDINDPVDPTNISYLAAEYRGENYFRHNGNETDFETFLTSYAKYDLKKQLINHTFVVAKDNISKTSSDKADHRYTVKGRLQRSSATYDDVLFKDESITAIVKYNGTDSEVSILELTFSTPLKTVKPVVRTEYKFEVDRRNSTLSVQHRGGKWRVAVKSWCREITSYPGTDKEDAYGEWLLTPYKVSAPYNLHAAIEEKTNDIVGNVRYKNSSLHTKTYSVKLTQTKTGKVLYQDISQEKGSIADYSPEEYNEMDAFYSLKYDFGLSYMYSFEDSRWSIGALVALNMDYFKTLDKQYVKQNSRKSDAEPSLVSVNDGYRIYEQFVYPQTDNYSRLLDPDNEARHYNSRCLFLAQGGFNITQWMRLDLGLGAASSQESHHLDNPQSVIVYSFQKTDNSLPDIDDIHEYHPMNDKEFHFNGKTKWGLAVRPAVVFNIPLASDFGTSLAAGVGYTFVSGIKNASSLDFSLGIRWEVF